ncbi:MAG: cysteine--tRNA ligase [Minisyncoccales bacterium]
MPLKIYNTLTRKKEIFKPLKNKRVGLYSCGPTVYDYDHLGHAWTYTQTDLLRRVLEYNGYKVKHVLNITDVGHLTSDADTGEDKMEKSAKEKKKSVWEIADYFIKIYFANRKKLNLLEPQIVCRATDHIPEMINLIKQIWKNGYAYQIDDGVYFAVQKFKKYGQLSGNTLEKLKAGARVGVNPQKKHPADFALWKFTLPGIKRQMEWDAPWGRGFPGWHIECSAMSMKYLGKTFDIHTGGEDNIFPHHESEIAQSEAATGKKFVRFWFHTKFLKIEGEKMSKSLKNFLTIADLEKKHFSGLALRYLFLTGHYRSPFNFTWRGLQAAQNTLNKLYQLISEFKPANFNSLTKKAAKIKLYQKEFLNYINDDLNIPQALALMWQIIKSNHLSSQEKYQLILNFDRVFGLKLTQIKKSVVPQTIIKLAQLREKYRQQKNWIKADAIRKKIEKMNYQIEDTPQGFKIKKIMLN